MGQIICKVELKPQFNIKAKLPRKFKKDIIKVSGRYVYREMIAKMEEYYSYYGYVKFNIKRK